MITINAKLMRVMYILYLVLWSFTDTRGYAGSSVKYIFLWAYIAIGLLVVYAQYVQGRREFKATYLTIQVFICCAAWTFISIVAMLFNGFEGPYLKDLFFLVTPCLFVFTMSNADSEHGPDFYYDMQIIALLATFFIMNRYKLNLNTLMSVNFVDSRSPFENPSSNTWSLLFMYYYTRKKPLQIIICAVMCYLTLKRLNVAFVLLILLGGWAIKNIRVTDKLINACIAIFIISPALISYFMSPGFIEWFDSTFEKTYYEFTMGRSQQLTEAMDYPESKMGLGMVNRLLDRHKAGVIILHSDILRVYWETTIVGLCVFTATFFNLAKINRNIYFLCTMIMAFLVLFASVNLSITENWLLIFMHAEFIGKTRSREKPSGALITSSA